MLRSAGLDFCNHLNYYSCENKLNAIIDQE